MAAHRRKLAPRAASKGKRTAARRGGNRSLKAKNILKAKKRK